MSNDMLSMQQAKNIIYINDSFDLYNNVQGVNANLLFPVIVKTNVLDWRVPPTLGCKQTCLELSGKNRSRMTIVAQFSPGRMFKQFGHNRGVELLVLSGTFSNADGDYGAGCYMRIPAKTYHEPFTRDGCTILFKLGHIQPLDRNQVVIDSRSSTVRWIKTREPGVSRIDLHHFSEEKSCLYRIRPECWITFKSNNHIIEIFVCEGLISVDDNQCETGTWLRYPVGSKVKILSKSGACLYIKTTLSLDKHVVTRKIK